MGKISKKIELIFVKKEKKAEKTYEFYFKRPDKFKYKPGHYLKVFLPHDNPDDRGTSRYFTISSSPLNKLYLTITTRVIKSSFKKKLYSLRRGYRMDAFGPLGYFNFDLKNKKSKLFLAGGIGITPYHSILETIGNKKIPFEILLLVSFPTQKEAVYLEELKNVESNNPKIKVIYTLTKESGIGGFESGRISKDLITKYRPDYLDCEIFIVGPESFEANMINLVKDMGVLEENIFTENFPGYK